MQNTIPQLVINYHHKIAGQSTTTKPGSSLTYGPDLTQHQSGVTECYDTYDDNNSTNSLKSTRANLALSSAHYFSELRPLSEHLYEQPMRLLATSSLERPSPSSLALPRCADPGQTSWTRVGEAGAKVSIARTAVSLTVPKGAIEPGRLEDVFVCVTSPSSSLVAPVLERDQVLITPVVVVGPLHLTAHLKKPVVVSIPHCGGPGLSQVPRHF